MPRILSRENSWWKRRQMSSLFPLFFHKKRILCDSKCKSSFALVLLICVDIIDHYSIKKRRNDHLDPYFAIIVLIYFKFSFIHYLMSRINKLDHDHITTWQFITSILTSIKAKMAPTANTVYYSWEDISPFLVGLNRPANYLYPASAKQIYNILIRQNVASDDLRQWTKEKKLKILKYWKIKNIKEWRKKKKKHPFVS